jgi:hypothetical protein
MYMQVFGRYQERSRTKRNPASEETETVRAAVASPPRASQFRQSARVTSAEACTGTWVAAMHAAFSRTPSPSAEGVGVTNDRCHSRSEARLPLRCRYPCVILGLGTATQSEKQTGSCTPALSTRASTARRIGSGRSGHAAMTRASAASGWQTGVQTKSALPEVEVGQGEELAAFWLLTGLFQVRVLVGEFLDSSRTTHGD